MSVRKVILVSACLLSVMMSQEAACEEPINLRGVRIWREERKIEVQGIVNMQQGLIELLATSPGGKEHESVFVLNCNPSLLQTGLLLIGLNPGIEGECHEDAPQGDPVFIYIRWKEEDSHLKRAENFVWDQKHGCAMPPTYWIFSGSRLVEDPQTGKMVFMANVNGVLVATFYDPDAILNNPYPERDDDTVYYANSQALPPRGTEITMIFSATSME